MRHDRRRADGQQRVGRLLHHHEIGDVVHERCAFPDRAQILRDGRRTEVRVARGAHGLEGQSHTTPAMDAVMSRFTSAAASYAPCPCARFAFADSTSATL